MGSRAEGATIRLRRACGATIWRVAPWRDRIFLFTKSRLRRSHSLKTMIVPFSFAKQEVLQTLVISNIYLTSGAGGAT